MAFVEGFSFEKAVFPFSRGKNRISQGVENRGSLISVPLALRDFMTLCAQLKNRSCSVHGHVLAIPGVCSIKSHTQ